GADPADFDRREAQLFETKRQERDHGPRGRVDQKHEKRQAPAQEQMTVPRKTALIRCGGRGTRPLYTLRWRFAQTRSGAVGVRGRKFALRNAVAVYASGRGRLLAWGRRLRQADRKSRPMPFLTFDADAAAEDDGDPL